MKQIATPPGGATKAQNEALWGCRSAALHACLDALRGTVSTETARQAFIAAAREVDILIDEAPPRG